MRAFLRDLGFLALFAAAVTAIVLVVAIHQGRFSLDPVAASPESSSPRSLAARPEPAPPVSQPAPMVDHPPMPPRDPVVARPSAQRREASIFEPTTRGAPGDARVLCVPEVTWLQDQLSRWAADARDARRAVPATLEAAHAAARRASGFSYDVSPECWNDPATLETRGWGDCADKSLWLARELLRSGYAPVGIRLGVPEDYAPGQPGHAWVVLYHHGSEWIYDPAASPRLTSQDAGPTKRFRITATVFPR